MLAITRTQYGSPEVLEVKEVEKPLPKANEVLIRVYATTVNRTDCGLLAGTPKFIRLMSGWPKPKKQIMGSDFAGQIEAVGEEVTKFRVGEANTKNLELIKSLGADRVINYETEDFTKDEEQYVYVFDAVGKSAFGKCKGLLLPKGIYMSSELGPGAENLYLPFLTKIKGGKRVVFPFPFNRKKTLALVKSLLEKGKFKPVIDRKYPVAEAQAAYEYVASGQKTGNVVLTYT